MSEDQAKHEGKGELEMNEISKKSQVGQQLSLNRRSIESLNVVISNIEKRLNNVLTDDVPEKKEVNNKEKANIVPLAREIKDNREMLEAQIFKLKNIVSRLQN